jgi:hypothetical protein
MGRGPAIEPGDRMIVRLEQIAAWRILVRVLQAR